MRQVLQELGSGKTVLAEVPEPGASPGSLRILTRRSLISAGTERMLIEFGRAGWLERIRQQPERVRQVMDKVSTDGLAATVAAVRSKLEQSLPLGYCNVGEVDRAMDAPGFAAGERVVSNGPHAEVVAVPFNLCARIPAAVSDDAAAFTVIGAIGLQGVRLAAPTLGESFVVTGLGLIGLMTVQLLRANGCRVLGIDPDPARTALARGFGASTVELAKGEDPLTAAAAFTEGRGADGVLITAATRSDEPISQAARMCRQRGRIVLVGVTGLQLNRADFYEKELTFQVSCSYGPGRHDPDYEEGGHDYPLGFVRWSEQRNFAAVLELLAARQLDVLPLITHRFALAEAPRAYDMLAAGKEACLGVLLEYPPRSVGAPAARTVRLSAAPAGAPSEPGVALVGAGNYAARVLLPALSRTGARLIGIASHGGVSAAHLGRKYGFSAVTTDTAVLLSDPRVNAVVIATRHDTHAALVQQALAAGKHVFVEKPLAITADEIAAIESVLQPPPGQVRPLLMVGFNRRFAPQIVRIKALLQSVPGPRTFIVTVNAGAVPAGHWTQAPGVGGGRIIGEGCHFIDLLRFLAGAAIVHWDVATTAAHSSGAADQAATITLAFADGSTGTVHYLPYGHASFAKERLEVFAGGRILQLDNFRTLRGYGWRGLRPNRRWRQDKGQTACVAAFIAAIRAGGSSPIPLEEILEVSRVTVAVGEAARRSGPGATWRP
jgi:predicted dehydrogenase/threonine dehydrogenase-like Zn-dependent dehydrogenase